MHDRRGIRKQPAFLGGTVAAVLLFGASAAHATDGYFLHGVGGKAK